MMNQDNAIEVRNLKKKFKIYHDKGKMLKERAINIARNRYEEHWVLNGISFDVKKGEAVGLIGHNGCGKSTTLKLLTQIMYPTSGTVEIQGRVSSLLELGAGFHPDLSGRENIYINASIFGLTKKEIDRRVEDIIAFSELEEFIDNPVRTYSSGMYMRLAFSVAINVDADVLLVDEILAVGDVNFQTKCFKKMQEIRKNGVTIVLVSHSLEQIESICTRCIWIHEGKIKEDGTVKEVGYKYSEYMKRTLRDSVEKEVLEQEKQIEQERKKEQELQREEKTNEEWKGRFGSGEIVIENVKCINSNNEYVSTLDFGEAFKITFDIKKYKMLDGIWFGLSIIRNDGVLCYGSNTVADEDKYYGTPDVAQVTVSFPEVELMPGTYYIDVCIGKGFNEFIDYWQTAKTIEIFGTRKDIGIVKMQHQWNIQ